MHVLFIIQELSPSTPQSMMQHNHGYGKPNFLFFYQIIELKTKQNLKMEFELGHFAVCVDCKQYAFSNNFVGGLRATVFSLSFGFFP